MSTPGATTKAMEAGINAGLISNEIVPFDAAGISAVGMKDRSTG
jgi:hypothetical protein